MNIDVDVDQFRVKRPWRDASFWTAALWSLALFVAVVSPQTAAWVHRNQEALVAAVAPLVAWLTLHGFIRWEGVRQLGNATAATIAAQADTDPAPEPAGVTKLEPVR